MTRADWAAGAATAGALFAVDPAGLGGVVLRAPAGPVRDRWLTELRALLPPGTPWRRVPLHVGDDRLLGALDLAATLSSGRPVAQRGLLAEVDGGIVLLAMAERLSVSVATRLAAVLDDRTVHVERDGLSSRGACRVGVIALDEGLDDDERVPARLQERLAFELDLSATDARDAMAWRRDDIVAARARAGSVRLPEPIVEALCAAALALGVDSVRASLHACRAARAAAALAGRDEATATDAAIAAALVLAPRATRLPAANSRPETPEESDRGRDHEAEAPPEHALDGRGPDPSESDAPRVPLTVEDTVLAAAAAAIPAGLLATLAEGRLTPPRTATSGRAGAARLGGLRGRPVGARRGDPRGGARLHLVETLRAAAPWQAVRRREAAAAGRATAARVEVRRADFHVWRLRQRSETTTVFVVDASGSAALHRLAETKGAVELLLADCYVRRDSVAVIAFRGAGAEVLLPPTRSLLRAKRSLAALPGGGGTPLAAGIETAHALADGVRRRGATPVLVLLTDGRANIARDGAPGRSRAGEDALGAARQLRAGGFATLLLDTAPQPQETARRLAEALGARYLPLPHADAGVLSRAVRGAAVAAIPPTH